MPTTGSTYPSAAGQGHHSLVNSGGFPGKPITLTPSSLVAEDPSARTGAVLGMMPFWQPVNICIGGTAIIRQYSDTIIPREPKEDDDAYNRRIFHSVMPPFMQRLAAQAAGTILRKGIHMEGGDKPYWDEWAKDVTGDGTPLNEFARRVLVDALLYGHTSLLVDFPAGDQPRTLADELKSDRKPYLSMVTAQQIRGWRTAGNRQQGQLSQVRYAEWVSEPKGQFGEDVIEQIRVLEPGTWEIWRVNDAGEWAPADRGVYSLDEVPLIPVYSNRLGTLLSRPPLLEVANLTISYCQRYTDYHHSIHVGAMPMLVLKGFDPDGNNELGLSTNTAILLPPDGDAFLVEPTSDAYDAQLKCLQTLEEQITSLGISTLAKQNLTNAAAEAKRLDRIDTDSIMSIISEDLSRAMEDVLRIAGQYAGKEPPKVSIPKDFENRLLDGNQITAMLQLQMQHQISQETLLRILQEGEVLPPYVDVAEEILRTKDEMEEAMQQQLDQAEAQMELVAENAPPAGPGGGATTGKAAGGATKGSQTLPTPMRPGKHAG